MHNIQIVATRKYNLDPCAFQTFLTRFCALDCSLSRSRRRFQLWDTIVNCLEMLKGAGPFHSIKIADVVFGMQKTFVQRYPSLVQVIEIDEKTRRRKYLEHVPVIYVHIIVKCVLRKGKGS